MRIMLYAGMLALTLATTACTGTSGPTGTRGTGPTDPQVAPSASPSATPSGPPVLNLEEVTSVRSDPKGRNLQLGSEYDVVLKGNLVAYSSSRDPGGVVFADAGTGDVLGSLKDGESLDSSGLRADLPPDGIVPEISGGWGSPTERLVTPIVQYTKGKEAGIAVISKHDNEVFRRIPLEGVAEDRVFLRAVEGRTALVQIDPPDTGSPRTQVRTRAYDLATGRMLWEAPGREPGTILDDDTVLLERPLNKWAVEDPSYVISAVDRATGKQKWDASKRYPRSDLIGAVERTLVVETGDRQIAILDVETGRELAHRTTGVDGCTGEDERFIACQEGSAGDLQVVRRHGERVESGHLPAPEGADFDGIWQWRIFSSSGGIETSMVGDVAGHRTADRIKGRLVAVEEGKAVFARHDASRDSDELVVVEARE